uniref:Uncharacterized protein n=2 Tax=viral metagenome TaxID=1070528 RepID=A0A6M3JCN8_9ZZZZ
MPPILTGNTQQVFSTNVTLANYDYDYPEGLNLKPGSELHELIKNRVLERARASANIISSRFSAWNDIDHKMTAYIDLTQKEEDLKSDDKRKPVSIVFPYSYAIMETVLSYLITAFLQEPVFRYEGASPEDILGAMLLELVVLSQCNKGKIGLPLHTNFRDAICYGMGVAAPMWKVRMARKTVKRRTNSSFMSFFGREEFTKFEQEVVAFEGNELVNIDPYKYLPDPNVPVHKVQDGEFVGWLDTDSYMNLLADEKMDEDLFNVKYVKHVLNRHTSIYSTDQSGRQTRVGSPSSLRDTTVTHPVDQIYMYVKLIPKEWKLSESEYPEKWMFVLAADEVVIKAKSLGLDHDMFPIAVAAPDFDGYSPTPISRMEMQYGLQEVLDFLFNTHIANVRKAINDMFVVDPYLVNINDLRDPAPGKLIRLRRPAWGRGVDKVVQQLSVQDITRANIADSSFIVQWMQKIGAADESMMGSLRQGGPERLTSSEFQGTRTGAISRLERIAKVIGLQFMQDIAYMYASHTQQLMTEETYQKITGRWQQDLRVLYGSPRVKISPFDILIDYDVMVRDGSIPGGNFNEVWIQLFKIISGTPELIQQFDTVKIFKHIALSLGAKNVEEFVRQKNSPARVMPDDQIEEQTRQGNLLPMGAL